MCFGGIFVPLEVYLARNGTSIISCSLSMLALYWSMVLILDRIADLSTARSSIIGQEIPRCKSCTLAINTQAVVVVVIILHSAASGHGMYILQFSPPLRFRANENSKTPVIWQPRSPEINTHTTKLHCHAPRKKLQLSPPEHSFCLGHSLSIVTFPVSMTGRGKVPLPTRHGVIPPESVGIAFQRFLAPIPRV